MVHFVGAGCSAADLITVRGARLLSEAGHDRPRRSVDEVNFLLDQLVQREG